MLGAKGYLIDILLTTVVWCSETMAPVESAKWNPHNLGTVLRKFFPHRQNGDSCVVVPTAQSSQDREIRQNSGSSRVNLRRCGTKDFNTRMLEVTAFGLLMTPALISPG